MALNDSVNDDEVHFKWTFVPTAKSNYEGALDDQSRRYRQTEEQKKSIVGRTQVFGRLRLTLLLLRLFQNYNCNID